MAVPIPGTGGRVKRKEKIHVFTPSVYNPEWHTDKRLVTVWVVSAVMKKAQGTMTS